MIEENNQIIRGLPIGKIRDILIKENSEPLVEISETEKLVLLKDHRYLSPYLRKSTLDRLIVASENLPENNKLLVETAHRPIWMQRELYRRREKQLAKKYPFKMIFRYPEWRNLVNRYTAPPGGSSHQTGAAVDVTIIGLGGKRFDMGTELTDFGEKVHTNCESITDEQKKNRKILHDSMIRAGFINYPLEWWHYSYGDRMWAAYTQRKECFYGPIVENQ